MSNVEQYVDQLDSLTTTLVQKIENVSYEELALFSDQREQLILSIQGTGEILNGILRQRLQKLSSFDSIILSRMNDFKYEASEWLSKQGAIKEQKNAYNSNYIANSMFFDQKN